MQLNLNILIDSALFSLSHDTLYGHIVDCTCCSWNDLYIIILMHYVFHIYIFFICTYIFVTCVSTSLDTYHFTYSQLVCIDELGFYLYTYIWVCNYALCSFKLRLAIYEKGVWTLSLAPWIWPILDIWGCGMLGQCIRVLMHVSTCRLP